MEELPPQRLEKLDPSKRITFIHQTTSFKEPSSETSTVQVLNTLTGQEARDFYESILSEPSTSDVKKEMMEDEKTPQQSANIQKVTNRYPEFNEPDRNAFLKAAQEGDKMLLHDYLKKGMPIDIMDSFFWTPLMVAAAAGYESICKFLLSHGANYNLVNSKDQSIFDILDENKNQGMAERLIDFINQQESVSPAYLEIPEDQFCAVCQHRYSGANTDHLTTTLHIYNAGKRGTTHSGIVIPESNIGYQLLKKKGWTEDKGLGKEGEGHKFPVRTILKRNRKGLGLEKTKAKVTHFQPHDQRAVQSEKNTEVPRNWKKEIKHKQAKESKIARNFRNAFNYDDNIAEYLV